MFCHFLSTPPTFAQMITSDVDQVHLHALKAQRITARAGFLAGSIER
jgi:hypothetical protein